MKTRFLKQVGMIVVVVFTLLTMTVGVASATPPDIIHGYEVTIKPQADGTLMMQYEFDYTATTDFPSNIQYLEIGVPNRHFTITDYGPKDWVTGASVKTTGGSWVHLDFVRLPKAGDRFQLHFTIHQERMAHLKGDDVSFQFIPGWFDFAQVDKLVIKWTLPKDSSQIRLLDPEPKTKEDNIATWETALKPNEKFTINLLFVKEAFPNLPTELSSAGEGGIPLWLIILIIVIVLVVLFIIIMAVTDDGGYSGGGYAGGSRGGRGGYRGGGGGGGGGRGGGGGGGFGGRGSSCACVSSCACACACAGGGRVGCSRKSFNISHFLSCRQQSGGE